jgi:hypothetical protein
MDLCDWRGRPRTSHNLRRCVCSSRTQRPSFVRGTHRDCLGIAGYGGKDRKYPGRRNEEHGRLRPSLLGDGDLFWIPTIDTYRGSRTSTTRPANEIKDFSGFERLYRKPHLTNWESMSEILDITRALSKVTRHRKLRSYKTWLSSRNRNECSSGMNTSYPTGKRSARQVIGCRTTNDPI